MCPHAPSAVLTLQPEGKSQESAASDHTEKGTAKQADPAAVGAQQEPQPMQVGFLIWVGTHAISRNINTI